MTTTIVSQCHQMNALGTVPDDLLVILIFKVI
jgi:hypothetical protein